MPQLILINQVFSVCWLCLSATIGLLETEPQAFLPGFANPCPDRPRLI